MKKSLILMAAMFIISLNAQIGIGKTVISGTGSIMEFDGNTSNQLSDNTTANTKGLILPAVLEIPNFGTSGSATSIPQNGTFLFDRQTKKNRFYENGVWKDLSDEGNNANLIPFAGTEKGNGVIVGASSSAAKGVLVFESADKALVLPHIFNPHLTVINPYPGMMCYDTQSNSIAVYDGTNWNYWK
ncbi:hypothetical protein [Chryseobacterium luquanense]|uniref:Uncharacterized protein n=1 Tax=Chryseobacterium luquanense TaxID=2983766 RepID=A0ABT3Y719_9FLAO|nr:hypothetical protein [Chryseobacterium luquanense]MCX8533947.1 hypothetical protein [Chryseobacterium luquanense]